MRCENCGRDIGKIIRVEGNLAACLCDECGKKIYGANNRVVWTA